MENPTLSRRSGPGGFGAARGRTDSLESFLHLGDAIRLGEPAVPGRPRIVAEVIALSVGTVRLDGKDAGLGEAAGPTSRDQLPVVLPQSEPGAEGMMDREGAPRLVGIVEETEEGEAVHPRTGLSEGCSEQFRRRGVDVGQRDELLADLLRSDPGGPADEEGDAVSTLVDGYPRFPRATAFRDATCRRRRSGSPRRRAGRRGSIPPVRSGGFDPDRADLEFGGVGDRVVAGTGQDVDRHIGE